MNLKEFHSLNVNKAKYYFNAFGNHPFFMIALAKDNNFIHCSKQFNDEATKRDLLNSYAVLVMVEDIKMYSIISEMWYYRTDKIEPFIQPSKKSDRKECLFIASQDINENVIVETFEIKRDDETIEIIKLELGFDCMQGINLFTHIQWTNMSQSVLMKLKKMYSQIDKPDWYSVSNINKFE